MTKRKNQVNVFLTFLLKIESWPQTIIYHWVEDLGSEMYGIHAETVAQSGFLTNANT